MVQLKYSVGLLLAAWGLVASQDLASMPACGQTCFTSMMEAQAATLGCAADESSCLCTKPDFHNGINDCAKQNCGADVAPTVSNLVVAFCATATVAQATPAPTTAPAAQETTPPPAPSTSPTPAPEVPTSSETPTVAESTPAETSVAPSPAASSSEPAPAPVSSTSSEPSQLPTTLVTSAKPTTTSSSTSSSASKTSSSSTTSSKAAATAAASETAAAEGKSSSPAAKLSMGAIVGIAIGGAAVLLAIVILAFIRRHHAKTQARKSASLLHQLKISDPMPGSGRSFADSYGSPPSPPQYPGDSASELEMRSRRYEDMVPRMAPRLIN